jgi:hypothetical protein
MGDIIVIFIHHKGHKDTFFVFFVSFVVDITFLEISPDSSNFVNIFLAKVCAESEYGFIVLTI